MEYAAFAEHHHFVVPKGSHWNDVRETTVNVGVALQEAMRNIEKANPDTLYGIFGDASWTNKNRLSDETLINLVEHYSQHKLSLSNIPDDKLGNAMSISSKSLQMIADILQQSFTPTERLFH